MYYLTDSIKYKIILGAFFIMNFTQFGVSATLVNDYHFHVLLDAKLTNDETLDTYSVQTHFE